MLLNQDILAEALVELRYLKAELAEFEAAGACEHGKFRGYSLDMERDCFWCEVSEAPRNLYAEALATARGRLRRRIREMQFEDLRIILDQALKTGGEAEARAALAYMNVIIERHRP